MKHIIIIDNEHDASSFGNLISNSFTFSVAESTDNIQSMSAVKVPDIISINADNSGFLILEMIHEIKSVPSLSKIPVIFVTSNNDCKYQEILCSCGADDIILMPMCKELIVKKMNYLIAAFSIREVELNDSNEIQFDEFINLLSEKKCDNGAYVVKHNDFANVYRFVLRGIERTKRSAQVLLLTLNNEHEKTQEAYEMNTMKTLSNAVKLCLRRGDMSSVCSKNQVVILLMGADDSGGHLVANRIISNFYSECDDNEFKINYDIREISINGLRA